MTLTVRYGIGIVGLAMAALKADVDVALLIMAAILVIPTPTDKSEDAK